MPVSTPLSSLTVDTTTRWLVTGALVLSVLVLFWVMVAKVMLAALLGTVAAVYLRPVFARVEGWTGQPTLAAVLTLSLLIVPSLAVLMYGYMEVWSAAAYLQQNAASVAARIQEAVTATLGVR